MSVEMMPDLKLALVHWKWQHHHYLKDDYIFLTLIEIFTSLVMCININHVTWFYEIYHSKNLQSYKQVSSWSRNCDVALKRYPNLYSSARKGFLGNQPQFSPEYMMLTFQKPKGHSQTTCCTEQFKNWIDHHFLGAVGLILSCISKKSRCINNCLTSNQICQN